ncbi:MAG: hypothetical protein L0K86_18545 [Actinomycetia bacterium]|nr:hypothetical protein [Actinomycetes bacterium]
MKVYVAGPLADIESVRQCRGPHVSALFAPDPGQKRAAHPRQAANASADLYVYGGITMPTWSLLMELAEGWALRNGWEPHPAGGPTIK